MYDCIISREVYIKRVEGISHYKYFWQLAGSQSLFQWALLFLNSSLNPFGGFEGLKGLNGFVRLYCPIFTFTIETHTNQIFLIYLIFLTHSYELQSFLIKCENNVYLKVYAPLYKIIIRIKILIIIYYNLYLFYKVYNILYKSRKIIGFELLFII